LLSRDAGKVPEIVGSNNFNKQAEERPNDAVCK
jgi:hypothetical protein